MNNGDEITNEEVLSTEHYDNHFYDIAKNGELVELYFSSCCPSPIIGQGLVIIPSQKRKPSLVLDLDQTYTA